MSKETLAIADELVRERERQIEREGYGADHDDELVRAELARAAASYCLRNAAEAFSRHSSSMCRDLMEGSLAAWPGYEYAYKPKDPRRNLIRAGALILAEIERLDRARRRAAS